MPAGRQMEAKRGEEREEARHNCGAGGAYQRRVVSATARLLWRAWRPPTAPPCTWWRGWTRGAVTGGDRQAAGGEGWGR